MNKNLVRKLLREALDNGLVKVYRCIDNEFKGFKKDYEFFAVNLHYAEHFGDNCYEFQINTNGANILDLEKWNKLYTEKTGKTGNLFNRTQGMFVIGSMVIADGYNLDLRHFASAMGQEMANKFREEFNNADAIYGEDAGYPNEFVYAVKNKDIVKFVGKV